MRLHGRRKMFRFSLDAHDAIGHYWHLIHCGMVQDDYFAEKVYEDRSGGCRPFDLRKELVFRWECMTPRDGMAAVALVQDTTALRPLRVWLAKHEFGFI